MHIYRKLRARRIFMVCYLALNLQSLTRHHTLNPLTPQTCALSNATCAYYTCIRIGVCASRFIAILCNNNNHAQHVFNRFYKHNVINAILLTKKKKKTFVVSNDLYLMQNFQQHYLYLSNAVLIYITKCFLLIYILYVVCFCCDFMYTLWERVSEWISEMVNEKSGIYIVVNSGATAGNEARRC